MSRGTSSGSGGAGPRERRIAGGSRVVVALGAAVLALTACGPGWWTPVVKETPIAPSASADVSVEASADLGPAATLDLTIETFPTRWNEMATANGSGIDLADPLVADDTTDGVSSITVPVGDGTLFVQWQADDGKILIAEVDVPIADDPTTSAALPIVEALAHAGLDLSAEESSAFVATTVADAVADAIDPSYIDATVSSGSADFALSIVSGTGSFIITPAVDDGSSVDDGSTQTAPSPSAPSPSAQ